MVYFGAFLVIGLFVFWRQLRHLGYSAAVIFDLFSFLIITSLLSGKVFSRLFWPLGFMGAPFFVPGAYFACVVSFFWFINRRKWSVFEVGDRFCVFMAIGLLGLSTYPLIFRSDLVLPAVLSFLILALILISSKTKTARGYKLFIFILVSLPILALLSRYSGLYDATPYSLTFLAALAILALLGIASRVRSKLKRSPMDLMAQLKDKLFKKNEAIKDAQLRLPQDDPFLVKGRVDDNAPEDEVDEQLGHDQIIAEASFLAKAKLQVDKALGRVKSGKYGLCERCGKKIDPERLEIDPSATLCITCATISESRMQP